MGRNGRRCSFRQWEVTQNFYDKGKKIWFRDAEKNCVLVNTLCIYSLNISTHQVWLKTVLPVGRATWLCSEPVVLFLCLHSDHVFLDWGVFSLENGKRGWWESKWTKNQSKKCEKAMFVSSLWHKVRALPDAMGRSCLKFQVSEQRKKEKRITIPSIFLCLDFCRYLSVS